MNKFKILFFLIITTISGYSQKKDKYLFEIGAEVSISLNRELFTNQSILYKPSMARLIFLSLTFPKAVYIESFYCNNSVRLHSLETNNFDDIGLLIGLNLVSSKSNSVSIALGPYLRFNDVNNTYQNGTRFGVSSKASFGINITEGVTAMIVWRESIDFLGSENYKDQAFLAQSSIGFSLNSNLIVLANKFKKNKKNSYY